MNFEICSTELFLEQLKEFDSSAKELIKSKIDLIKQNPFRFKRINSKKFSRVFRVRLSINSIDTRLIYVIIKSKIILVCLFDRSKGYFKMEKMLAKMVQP